MPCHPIERFSESLCIYIIDADICFDFAIAQSSRGLEVDRREHSLSHTLSFGSQPYVVRTCRIAQQRRLNHTTIFGKIALALQLLGCFQPTATAISNSVGEFECKDKRVRNTLKCQTLNYHINIYISIQAVEFRNTFVGGVCPGLTRTLLRPCIFTRSIDFGCCCSFLANDVFVSDSK